MIPTLIKIAKEAGKILLSFYNKNSLADKAAHIYICNAITKNYPDIPIISEEAEHRRGYHIRKNWEYFFLIDPLDGTKEFMQANGEFTVNIALIEKNKPILGIIYVPVSDITYYAEKNKGAYKIESTQIIPLPIFTPDESLSKVVISRSHVCESTLEFLNQLPAKRSITVLKMGSALKFAMIAEGSADIYPRFSPTMEWDTAAGQIIVNEVGKKVLMINSKEELYYNKEELINSGFIVM